MGRQNYCVDKNYLYRVVREASLVKESLDELTREINDLHLNDIPETVEGQLKNLHEALKVVMGEIRDLRRTSGE